MQVTLVPIRVEGIEFFVSQTVLGQRRVAIIEFASPSWLYVADVADRRMGRVEVEPDAFHGRGDAVAPELVGLLFADNLLHVHVGHGEESIFGNPSTGITACFGHLRDGQYAVIDMLLVISH